MARANQVGDSCERLAAGSRAPRARRTGKAEEAKDRIADASATVKDRLGDAKDVVTDRGGTALSLSRRVIKQHPLIAVGLAFGVGYIAMRIAR